MQHSDGGHWRRSVLKNTDHLKGSDAGYCRRKIMKIVNVVIIKVNLKTDVYCTPFHHSKKDNDKTIRQY